jgi:outer membrane receptor protein involved in Fe transport
MTILTGSRNAPRCEGLKRYLMLSTGAVFALHLSTVAQAQNTPVQADEPAATAVSEIIVTGSRVVTNGNDQPTPVTVVGADQLMQSKPTLPVEALVQVPSLSNSTTRNSIGGSTALGPGSFLNLRGLGATRTLVLMDGRRLAPSTNQGTIDAALLPSLLIQRVEVVTGGASAAYGSDAVSGAVNFVLDSKFSGVKGEASYGETFRGDVPRYRAALAYGGHWMDDRLHLLVTGEYFKAGGLGTEQGTGRSYLNRRGGLIPNPAVTGANPASPTNPRFLMATDVNYPYATFGGLIVGGPLDGTDFGPGGVPRPLVSGTMRSANAMVGGSGAFFSQYINYSSPLELFNTFGRLSFDATPDVTAFVQVMYGENKSIYIQDPPFQTQGNAFTIYRGNPFIPAAIATRMEAGNEDIASFRLGRVAIDWPFMTAHNGYRTFDLTAGLNGKMGDWRWDFYYEHGVSKFHLNMHNEPNLARTYEAADVVLNPANNQPICRTTLLFDPNNGCVPLNLFGPNAASSAALGYIQGTLMARQTLVQNVASVSASGPLVDLWAGPIQLGFGAEYRSESGDADSDPISQGRVVAGDIRGIPAGYLTGAPGGWQTNNPQPLKGKYNIKEVFAEVQVPLAHDLPMLYALDLNAAGRLTDYSTSGSVTTWKVGLVYAPVQDLRLRATRSRDIRAPNIAELFAGNAQSYVTVTDPNNGNAQVVNVTNLRRGNRDLKPEIADTLTLGAVFQPSFLRGFSASLDWYKIKVGGAIGQLNAQDEVTLCFQGNADICKLITREGGAANGRILVIETPSLNLQRLKASGLDIEVGYSTALGGGQLGLRALGSYLAKMATSTPTPAGIVTIDRAGDIGVSAQPKWRWTGSIDYDIGDVGLTLNGRYIGSGNYNNTYTKSDLADEYQKITDVLYVDAMARYKFHFNGGEQTLFFSVTNLMDKKPLLIPANNFNATQTVLALYNVEGRSFTAGLRFKF